jgi:CubicO group peptidase (beta-lactamase class C family)
MDRRSLISAIATSVLAVALLSAPAAHSGEVVTPPEQLGFDPDRLQRVTNAFQGYVDSGQIPGAVVLIARNGKIAYSQAIGYQDREKQVPMTATSIFRIASMTKPIVSVAVMMLIEEGKLDISAPVGSKPG